MHWCNDPRGIVSRQNPAGNAGRTSLRRRCERRQGGLPVRHVAAPAGCPAVGTPSRRWWRYHARIRHPRPAARVRERDRATRTAIVLESRGPDGGVPRETARYGSVVGPPVRRRSDPLREIREEDVQNAVEQFVLPVLGFVTVRVGIRPGAHGPGRVDSKLYLSVRSRWRRHSFWYTNRPTRMKESPVSPSNRLLRRVPSATTKYASPTTPVMMNRMAAISLLSTRRSYQPRIKTRCNAVRAGRSGPDGVWGLPGADTVAEEHLPDSGPSAPAGRGRRITPSVGRGRPQPRRVRPPTRPDTPP
jgi:hypothetical protein